MCDTTDEDDDVPPRPQCRNTDEQQEQGSCHPSKTEPTEAEATATAAAGAAALQYQRLGKNFLEGMDRDKSDIDSYLERERQFTVDYNRMSRNIIWAAATGPDCPYYNGTVEEYMDSSPTTIWPRGRNLHELSFYGQISDFFRFMWNHTKPYKTVVLILLMSISRPFQVAMLGWVTQYIDQEPAGTPLWLYFAGFYGYALDQLMYWWYQMWVPLNSQRVQLRTVLLKQRCRLPATHPLAVKWPAGRFIALLKDVDDVINGIWQSCLHMIDDMVTMVYLLILCFVNLAVSLDKQNEFGSYGTYIGVFLALAAFTMIMPFVWFHMFDNKVQECETMVRDGQGLYMSASSHRLMMGGLSEDNEGSSGRKRMDDCCPRQKEQQQAANEIPVKSYWVYGRTTFRAFFHRLAWKTNYGVIVHLWGPLVAYGLLTGKNYGEEFSTANIMIVLLSLKGFLELSVKLLDYLVKMSRGCNALKDVADLINANVHDTMEHDMEEGRNGPS